MVSLLYGWVGNFDVGRYKFMMIILGLLYAYVLLKVKLEDVWWTKIEQRVILVAQDVKEEVFVDFTSIIDGNSGIIVIPYEIYICIREFFLVILCPSTVKRYFLKGFMLYDFLRTETFVR